MSESKEAAKAAECLDSDAVRRAKRFVLDLNEGGWEAVSGSLLGKGGWGGTVQLAAIAGGRVTVTTDNREFAFDVVDIANPDAYNASPDRRRCHVIRATQGSAAPMLTFRKKTA